MEQSGANFAVDSDEIIRQGQGRTDEFKDYSQSQQMRALTLQDLQQAFKGVAWE
ncbi:GL18907 [Drosophila persimilis]|uniref:GL18907 n=1 Tax=Drosophila persimilis TaxID=7234 RepID=B4ISK5_DROPE|nr:GL18907 [Drosophila persimilis]